MNRTASVAVRRRGGMTLIEVLISSAVAGLVCLGVAGLVFYTGRIFAAMTNYVDLDDQSRNALDIMSQQIRQVNRLITNTTTSLTFEDSDGLPLEFVWDPNAQTLTRIKNGVPDPAPLLQQCTFCEFSIYQRNPIGGVYDEYPAATPDTCKLVQLHWVCQRSTLGTIFNTESVQSAKVVIRKE